MKVWEKYTDSELNSLYDKFMNALEVSFKDNPDRLKKLKHMYSESELGPNLMLAPASGNKDYHNSYIGGYMDHVLNVSRNSLRLMKLYEQSGGTIDFTQEELLFAAFHHDLGKLGIKGESLYLPNDSQWHVENRGLYFKFNTSIPTMNVTDRSFYLLNEYEIKYNTNEWFGIKLADGMFGESGNESYFRVFDPNKAIKCNIPYIIHWADWMSCSIENDQQKAESPF